MSSPSPECSVSTLKGYIFSGCNTPSDLVTIPSTSNIKHAIAAKWIEMASLCNIPSFTHSFYKLIKHWVQRYGNAALVISSHTGCASETALILPPPQITLLFLQPSSSWGPRSGQVSLSPLGHTVF